MRFLVIVFISMFFLATSNITSIGATVSKGSELYSDPDTNPFAVNDYGMDMASRGKILQRFVDPVDYLKITRQKRLKRSSGKASQEIPSEKEKIFKYVREGGIGLEELKKYIALGGDLNKPTETGELLLNIAASRYNDKKKCVEFLLANGVNPNKTDYNGQTALFHAAKCGNSKNIITLIKHGCSVNARDKFGQTPLFYASADGNINIVKYLIEKGADVNAVSKFGETPLIWAAFGDGNNRRNKKVSPVVSLLISNGADINHISNAGLTPLWASVFTDDFPTAKMLIKRGARIEYETHHRIIDESMNHVNFITFLLNNGLNPNVIVSADSHWSDPSYSSGKVKQKIDAPILYWATQKNHEEIVKLLLSKGADLNSKAANGETSLITAIDKNNEKIVNTLITAGADLTVTRDDGQAPLIRAAKKGRKKLVKRLIAAGATITPEEFNQFIEIDHNVNRMKKDGIYADLQSATLLHPTMAKMWGVNQDGTATDEHLRVDDLDECASSMTMLELSSYLQSKSFSKEQLNRALHFAAERNSDSNVLKLLADKGGDVNDSEKPQILGAYNPVIFSAVIGNKLKNIEMLISLGANIHSLDNQEEGTLLHLAASLGYADIVKLLLKYGCNKNIEDRFGSKAIDIARDNKHEEIVKILSK